jgi:hypothetical protein
VTAFRGGAAAILLAIAAGVRPAAAQAVPNRAEGYLTVTDVSDARALWVNPAGLAIRHEASIHLDFTVRQPGGRGQLGQVTAGFNTRGLSFGYQRDILPSGIHGHTYRLGLAGAYNRFAAGVGIAMYRGGTKGTSWDIGSRYELTPQMAIGAVLKNIGQPTVRGVRQDLSFVPATTVRLAKDLLAISVQASLGSALVRGYTLAARATLPGPLGLGLIGRVDTDGSWRRRGFAFGLSVGHADQVGLVGSAPGDFGQVDAASLYGVSSRVPR